MKQTTMKTMLASVAVLTSALAFGEPVKPIDTFLKASDGDIVPGEWNLSFAKGKAYADAHNTPMIFFWGNTGCTFCFAMAKACTNETFTTWAKQKKVVMVVNEGVMSTKEFAKYGTGRDGKAVALSAFPFLAVYWKKADGSEVKYCFSGRRSLMYHKWVKGETLDQELSKSVDEICKGWVPPSDDDSEPEPEPEPEPVKPAYCGGEFLVPDVAGARLEAVAGVTRYVGVPLTRTNATEYVATNLVVCGTTTNTVVWAAGSNSRTVNVSTRDMSVGDARVVTLLDSNGSVRSTIRIHGVEEPENTPSNPKFVGEDFGFGEWTMDYEAARAKVAATEGSHLLAMFAGPLWCPYCKGMDGSLLASAEFKSWAVENKVALVLFDQGRAASPATAAGLKGPRLVTYVNDPRKSGADSVSGASYVSRKTVTVEQANAYMSKVTAYTKKWLSPDSTAARLGNPTILLVNGANETVAARFSAYREAGTEIVYDVAENIRRLNELLTLDGASERDNFLATTTATYRMGDSKQVAFKVSDRSKSFKVSSDPGYLTFSAAPAAKPVTMTLCNGSTVVAVGTNTLEATVVSVASAGLKLKLEAAFGKGDSGYTATLTGSRRAFHSDNAYISSAFTTMVPLKNGGTIVGALDVSATKAGRFSVKYTSAASSRTYSFTGKWPKANEFGEVTVSVVRSGITLTLNMDAEGVITASISGDSAYPSAVLSGAGGAAAIDYSKYAGVYNVALPAEGVTGKIAAATGAGYVIVKADSSSTRRRGKVSCSIMFPDGKGSSCTAQLTAGGNGFANLLVVKRASKNYICVPMQIRPLASGAATHRAVKVQAGATAYWKHSETGYSFTRECGVYGSRYDKKESLLDCCGFNRLTLNYDLSGFADSATYGALKSVTGEGAAIGVAATKLSLAEKIAGMSLSFARSTGVAKGRGKVDFAGKTGLSMTFVGVVLPDWHDCGCYDDDATMPLPATDLPVVIGCCTLKDKVGRTSVTRGFPFGFFAPAE